MTGKEAPGVPPQIQGFSFRQVIGSGGFSTVYLYEQLRPRRPVAIKVLKADGLSDTGVRRFESEANLMAALSNHPYIVTIHDAGISDDGHPYLVMEYYPGPNLGVRARSEALGVAEVLQIGVRIASAVETAHRAGILHRDIKPANVLTSQFDRPGLTDFGISATIGAVEEESGLSIPWAPPEALDADTALDRRSDVYSLGALVYHLLTGRSPFETAGARATQSELMARIRTQAAVPTGRMDVPPDLEAVLLQALSKRPELRPSSALAFARALQAVEQDLSLSPTHIDVMQALDSRGHTPQDPSGDALQFIEVTGDAQSFSSVQYPAKPLVVADAPAGEHRPQCPACGARNDSSWQFCSTCGAPRPTEASTEVSDLADSRDAPAASDQEVDVEATMLRSRKVATPEPPVGEGQGEDPNGDTGATQRVARSVPPVPIDDEPALASTPAASGGTGPSRRVIAAVAAIAALVVIVGLTLAAVRGGSEEQTAGATAEAGTPAAQPDGGTSTSTPEGAVGGSSAAGTPASPPAPEGDSAYRVRVDPQGNDLPQTVFDGTLTFDLSVCVAPTGGRTSKAFEDFVRGAKLFIATAPGEYSRVEDAAGDFLQPIITAGGPCTGKGAQQILFTTTAVAPPSGVEPGQWTEPVTYRLRFPTPDGFTWATLPDAAKARIAKDFQVSTSVTTDQ